MSRLALPDACEAVVALRAARGQVALTEAQRAELAATHEQAAPDDVLLRLLTRPFSGADIPEYYRYTGLHVYSWFLEEFGHDPVGGSVLALHATLGDLKATEERAARGPVVVPEHIVERLRRLAPLTSAVRALPIDFATTGEDVVRHAEGSEELRWRTGVLTRCTAFPYSDKHDEHVFLRSVHVCELVFFLVRWIARRLVEIIGDDRDEVLFRLGQLTTTANLLTDTFHMLKTLTPELFMGFRDATGAASAVQSLNYHLMELVVYGYDERKAETYERFAHLRVLNDPALREHQSLRDVLLARGDVEFLAEFAEVERILLTWRGRHYGFGRKYLADIEGSGGTDGAAYLKRYVDKDPCVSGHDRTSASPLLSEFAVR
ncbi:tryptophan 2,3-dioxygenase family protein [Actinokineospora sp. 24-640]